MIKGIVKILLSIIVIFLIFVNLPVISVNHKESNKNYSNWMNENIEKDLNLVDIKMLGAHDAFSREINIFSKADIYAGGTMKGLPGTILKGFLVKQSVTQIADTNELLKSGVRYLDIRLTYNNEKWTTKHNFTSSKFPVIAKELVTYLNTYKGEFLILDFQHIDGLDYNNREDYLIFRNMLEDVGLLDFNYNSKILGDITYNDITENKTTSNIVIIDKFTINNKQTYYYDKSIRSNWANNDSFVKTVDILKVESDYIQNSTEYDSFFRIMQAVTTMQMSLPGLGNSIKTWSLVERASDFNNYLINRDEFETIMTSLPIVMVDYSNSNENDFLDNIMEIIIDSN